MVCTSAARYVAPAWPRTSHLTQSPRSFFPCLDFLLGEPPLCIVRRLVPVRAWSLHRCAVFLRQIFREGPLGMTLRAHRVATTVYTDVSAYKSNPDGSRGQAEIGGCVRVEDKCVPVAGCPRCACVCACV
jgi:hypothetical protein